MASKPKILIFLGTIREIRLGSRVGLSVKNMLAKQGMEPEIIDPLDYPFEVLKKPMCLMRPPYKDVPEWMLELDNKVRKADGYIVVSAEYYCSIPPALTNMLDHFGDDSFRHRPCGIVTYNGGFVGGARAQVILRPFLSDRGMISTPFPVAVSEVNKEIEEDGTCSEWIALHLGRMVQEVGWYAGALRDKREKQPAPDFYMHGMFKKGYEYGPNRSG